jgi:hypothetical protein
MKSLAQELARCDREILELETRPDNVAGLVPAFIVTMGVEDWRAEKRRLLREHLQERFRVA